MAAKKRRPKYGSIGFRTTDNGELEERLDAVLAVLQPRFGRAAKSMFLRMAVNDFLDRFERYGIAAIIPRGSPKRSK